MIDCLIGGSETFDTVYGAVFAGHMGQKRTKEGNEEDGCTESERREKKKEEGDVDQGGSCRLSRASGVIWARAARR